MDRENLHVLLVEDNPGDARLVREALSGLDAPRFTITHVETLADAGLIVGTQPVDLVLLDLSLADDSRLRTLAVMGNHDARVPVLVFTGIEDELLGLWTALEGVQGYVIKGELTPEQLAAKIQDAIHEYGARRSGPDAPAETTRLRSRARASGQPR